MLTIAYIGNGKSANRYHLPFALKLKDQIKVKTIKQRQNWLCQWIIHNRVKLAVTD
ncbi:oxidoreductase, YhhX family [Lactiplantibacillus plantarum]|nr:oxidoreductase, YhhX family [Lactiplantibacillus plantarum]